MISNTQTLFTLASLATTVLGHGYVMSPPARKPGPAMAAACGQQMFYNQNSDFYGNVQGELQVANNQADYNAAACNVWQCKGYKLADNTANVQTFTAGQVVPMTVEIRAPHEGTANVSIVSTKANRIIGQPLISWAKYASNSAPIPADQTKFDITIPTDIGGQCATAGDCVIQWYWDARSIDQTYEACVDFTVAGSGGGGGGSGTAPPTPVTSSRPVASPTTTAAPTQAPVTTTRPSAVPSSTPQPPPSTGGGSGSGDLPESFTLDTFITWLRSQAGRTGGRSARRHARDMM